MPEVYAKSFDLIGVPNLPPSYNVAPTQEVLAARLDGDQRTGVALRWGLIPSWAKDKKTNFINARSETLAEKAPFRVSFKRRRCLILADGYYEWKTLGPKQKQAHYFRRADDAPIAFAGIWDSWKNEAGVLDTCAIITTNANELSLPIHDRMPAILCGADADAWLDPEIEEPKALLEMLRPFPAVQMACYPVGPLVNSVRNNVPACITAMP